MFEDSSYFHWSLLLYCKRITIINYVNKLSRKAFSQFLVHHLTHNYNLVKAGLSDASFMKVLPMQNSNHQPRITSLMILSQHQTFCNNLLKKTFDQSFVIYSRNTQIHKVNGKIKNANKIRIVWLKGMNYFNLASRQQIFNHMKIVPTFGYNNHKYNICNQSQNVSPLLCVFILLQMSISLNSSVLNKLTSIYVVNFVNYHRLLKVLSKYFNILDQTFVMQSTRYLLYEDSSAVIHAHGFNYTINY